MNYFERLVRRALLRPASAPGGALDDPFATLAEWPLEPPAPTPAPEAAVLVDAPLSIEPARPVENKKRAAGATRETPRPVDAPAPPAALPGPLPPTAVETRQETPMAERADAPAPPAAPIAPQREALDLADAFMRSLGVQSQLPELAPAPPPEAVAVQASVAAVQQKGPPTASPAQVVAPIVPPSPLPLHPAVRAAPKPDAPASAAAREPRREPAARTRTVVETRHVVVERSSGAGGETSVSGGGAPRFGLGQL